MHDQEELITALKGCARRQRKSLQFLFESEAPRLYAIAGRILRDPTLTEEAVQDALIKVWTRAETYKPEKGLPRPWLAMIVRNCAISIARAEGRSTVVDHGEITRLQDSRGADETVTVLRRLDPSARLRTCLEALEGPKREAVMLAFLYGFSHGEIAGRLGLPLGTIKSRVRRALDELRGCLG